MFDTNKSGGIFYVNQQKLHFLKIIVKEVVLLAREFLFGVTKVINLET